MIFAKSLRSTCLSIGAATCMAVALSAFPTSANAAFPDRPIHLIVPFSAGGPSDVLGRTLAQRLAVSIGEPVLVENKPGAGTNLAAEYVARSKPDGYTLFLMMIGTQAINQAMYPDLRYNTIKDFLISKLPQQAHPVSQWRAKMTASQQEMRHADEPCAVSTRTVDA